MSTPALARCSQVIFGPFGPYTFANWALVGRPASAKSRLPSAIRARARLDRTWACFAGLFARFAAFAFLVFILRSSCGTQFTITE